ncbi:MAG: bifunctional diguanylate cyclase/phosphodiesterase [Mycobacteriales bacterium]
MLSQLAALRVRLRGQMVVFVWGEGALLLGLVLLPAAWQVLITACCMTFLALMPSRVPIKALYNAASATIATGAAAAVASLFFDEGRVSGMSWQLVVGLTVAGLVFTAVTGASASAAVALAQAEHFLATLRVGLGLELLTGFGNVGAALMVVALAGFDPWLLATVPMLVFVLQIAYHSRLRGQQERETWTRLENTTRSFTQLVPAAVAQAAIEGIIAMFQADRVDVLFVRSDGSETRFDGERAGLEPPADTEPDGESQIVVPLGPADEALGSLTLNFSQHVTLNGRERHALATLATALGVALANADHYQVTRDFADAKAIQALTDPVTGLGNRLRLVEAGSTQLADAAARGAGQALLLVNLDHFKDVNDTLGRDTGDRLLIEIASRLSAILVEGELVVRLGTHEFAILAETSNDRPLTICVEVIESLDQPMILDGLNISAPASIGIACFPEDALSVRDLLRMADAACRRAGSASGRYARYDADRDQPHADRLLILEECRTGLDNAEFVLHYQPKVDLATREIRGVEALVRWQHPTRGLLQPFAFMPAVERSALVHEFTSHVLDLAFADCARWLDQDQDYTLSVNLSARNLLDLSLPDDVRRLLNHHRLPPHQLVLEVTETAMMSDLDTVDTVLARLRDIGVQLSLDDFGTGYSSLSVLSRVAVDEVKIDLSFVSRMLTSPRDAVVVRGTLSLANGLGLDVVAEGVEIEAQHERLLELGCQSAQGYYYCPPIPVRELYLLPRCLPSTSAIHALPPPRAQPTPFRLPA